METLSTIWGYVLPIGGGITLGAIVIAIATILVKGILEKVVARIDIDKTEEKAVAAGIEKLKTVSFKQSIEPIVKSRLEGVCETVLDNVDEKLDIVDDRYAKLVNVLTKLAAYFDNSLVPEETKADLRAAIADANGLPVKEVECIIAEEKEAEKAEAKKASVVR